MGPRTYLLVKNWQKYYWNCEILLKIVNVPELFYIYANSWAHFKAEGYANKFTDSKFKIFGICIPIEEILQGSCFLFRKGWSRGYEQMI